MWRGYTVEGYHDIHWLAWLWSAQVKVEGIVLKAACHWGSNSSVVNNPLGEPGHTPFYVGFPSTQGFLDSDSMFFPPFCGRTP